MAIEVVGEAVEISSENVVVRVGGDTVLSPPLSGTRIRVEVELPTNGAGTPQHLVGKGVVDRVIQLENGDRLVRCQLHQAGISGEAKRRGRRARTAWTM